MSRSHCVCYSEHDFEIHTPESLLHYCLPGVEVLIMLLLYLINEELVKYFTSVLM